MYNMVLIVLFLYISKQLGVSSEFTGKMLRIGIHTRGWWQFSLADIKKIFCRSDLSSKISHVLVVQLETFSL